MKTFTEETRKKLSESAKRRWEKNKTNTNVRAEPLPAPITDRSPQKMNLGIAEVLNKAESFDDDKKRAEYALKAFDASTQMFVKMFFDPRFEWELPPGTPPYHPSPALDQEFRLKNELRKMYLFMKGGQPGLRQAKRELLFIQVLESVMPLDALLLVAMKDRKWPYKMVSKRFIEKTFPGLLSY